MMVVTPAEVAKRAAMSLVAIPPVPTLEPAVDTIPERFQHIILLVIGMKNINTIYIQSTDILHNFNRLSIRMCSGIVRVQAVHIRH